MAAIVGLMWRSLFSDGSSRSEGCEGGCSDCKFNAGQRAANFFYAALLQGFRTRGLFFKSDTLQVALLQICD